MSASFAVSAALALRLALRSGKTRLHWVMLALLGALILWTGGAAWRYQAGDLAEIQAAYRLMFCGIAMAPGIWLLMASLFARIERFEMGPRASVAVLLPGFLFYLAFVTNDAHEWVGTIDETGFTRGPLFFAYLAWGYVATLASVALLISRVRWTATEGGVARATLLVAAALTPIATSVANQVGWLSPDWDPTGVALGFSAALLYPLVFRLGFLDRVPVVRRDVFDHLNDAVIVTDTRGQILDANPAAERALSSRVERLRGRLLGDCLEEILEPADHGVARLALLDPGPEGPRILPEVTTLTGRLLRVSAGVLSHSDGQVGGSVVVLHDRTEERKSERALRQAQKLESVGFLAAGVAHEVNNPLAFVRSNLAQLQRLSEGISELAKRAGAGEQEDLAELPEIVAETLEGVDRIRSIVDKMRRLSRDATDQEGPVNVNVAVEEAVRFAQLHRGSAQLEVEVELAPNLPTVQGNIDGLVQVFLNLLLNARQALADRDGRIRVESQRRPKGIAVSVSDDGPGIPEAIRERIFDPFFTTKAPDEGTGLGLAIAYDIVREHKGTLEVDSQPGRGAVFTVLLPTAS